VSDLAVLAEMRGRGQIRVLIDGARAWICWELGSELLQEMLVRRILPVPGAVLYHEREGCWFRLGEHLPRFDVARGDGSDWPLLERTIFPEPVEAMQGQGRLHEPMRISLARDAAMRARPASALRCTVEALAAWGERATSAELGAVRGAWLKPAAPGGADGLVLVTGPTSSLPPLDRGERFWGTELLIPLGCRAEPDLPASAIRRAAGATTDDLALLEEGGLELIPRAIMKPLSRAAIRLIGQREATERESS
jgi:hypothetical protein